MQERRKQERVTISAKVDLSSEDNFYAGAARDISLGGLFVVTKRGFPIGSELTVVLRLPSKALSLRSEVMWSVAMTTETVAGRRPAAHQTVGLGLRFVGLPAGAKQEIESFMKLRQPIEFSMEDARDSELPVAASGRDE